MLSNQMLGPKILCLLAYLIVFRKIVFRVDSVHSRPGSVHVKPCWDSTTPGNLASSAVITGLDMPCFGVEEWKSSESEALEKGIEIVLVMGSLPVRVADVRRRFFSFPVSPLVLGILGINKALHRVQATVSGNPEIASQPDAHEWY